MPSTGIAETTRIVINSGVTNGSGDYVVTYSPAFNATPHLSASILNQTNPNHKLRISNASSSGCTVRVEVQNESFLALLGVNVLTSTVSPVTGASVSVMAIST